MSNVVRLVQGSEYGRWSEEERCLQWRRFSFDAATFELWWSLLHGWARLVVRGQGESE